MLGDLNVAYQPIDVHNAHKKEGQHGYTKEERAGFKAFLDIGLSDVWRERNPDKIEYTWWSAMMMFKDKDSRAGKPGWRIDYVLITKEH